VKKDSKGKEKSWALKLVRDDLVQDMTKPQVEAEIKELEGLREDLALKVRITDQNAPCCKKKNQRVHLFRR
jgi:hypothetical protein